MITANGSAAAVTIYKASVIATAESTNAGIYGIYGANGAHITLTHGVAVQTAKAPAGYADHVRCGLVFLVVIL